MKKVLVFLLGLVVVLTLLLSGIPQDAIRAYRGTHAGDRLRYFHYLQTARWEGVPNALDKYGINP